MESPNGNTNDLDREFNEVALTTAIEILAAEAEAGNELAEELLDAVACSLETVSEEMKRRQGRAASAATD